MTNKLLTTSEAAKALGLSTAFLERDRWAGAKIPFVRLGRRAIRYRPEDIEAFIESSVMRSTSEYPSGQAVSAA
jgi:excisionase family DNA binding protein